MKTNILIVEDDIYLREGLCELLNKEGYEVASASNFYHMNDPPKATVPPGDFLLFVLKINLFLLQFSFLGK